MNKLYKMQKGYQESILDDEKSKEKSETWFLKDTIDYWRHIRIRNSILPLIEHFPMSSWLTIGDGRYGTDANYLLEKGLNVCATDIQDRLLKISNDRGFIKEYSRQNAENLSFQDNQFDFVYCKESYHHFPRPAIAVYEMLRVSKIGIVLQEPKDTLLYDSILQIVSNKLMKIVGLKKEDHNFEESGNYVYKLSSREIEKYALGLGYRFVASKVQQDYYQKGVEFQKVKKESKLFKKIKKRILLAEFLQKVGLINGGILTGIILKEMPEKNLVTQLRKSGYKITILPENPYL